MHQHPNPEKRFCKQSDICLHSYAPFSLKENPQMRCTARKNKFRISSLHIGNESNVLFTTTIKILQKESYSIVSKVSVTKPYFSSSCGSVNIPTPSHRRFASNLLHGERTWGMWKLRGDAGVRNGPVLPTRTIRRKTTLSLKTLMKSRWES